MNTPFELSLAELQTRTSAKWREYPPEVLPLWVAEMDTLVAPPIAYAVAQLMRRGDTGYPAGTGFAEAMAGFAATRWDWAIDTALVRPMADVMNGLIAVLRLVIGPGDAVVLTPPVYPPFFDYFDDQGFELVMAPLTEAGRLDPDTLTAAFRRATDERRRAALVLANPHNPTGTVHTRAELTAVAELAEEFGVRVVVDEIHAPVVHPGARFTPYLSVPGGDRGFSVISASKGWNLAALKAALLITGAGGADDLARLSEVITHGASAIGILAQTVALTEAVEWLDDHLRGLDANRFFLAELLAQRLPEVGYSPPEATYLAWLDCRRLNLGDDPAQTFLDRGQVAFNSGPTFGRGGAGHVRLNFATSRAILTDAVDRMARSVQLTGTAT